LAAAIDLFKSVAGPMIDVTPLSDEEYKKDLKDHIQRVVSGTHSNQIDETQKDIENSLREDWVAI
jgi:hypothetical protein